MLEWVRRHPLLAVLRVAGLAIGGWTIGLESPTLEMFAYMSVAGGLMAVSVPQENRTAQVVSAFLALHVAVLVNCYGRGYW